MATAYGLSNTSLAVRVCCHIHVSLYVCGVVQTNLCGYVRTHAMNSFLIKSTSFTQTRTHTHIEKFEYKFYLLWSAMNERRLGHKIYCISSFSTLSTNSELHAFRRVRLHIE